MPCWPSPTATLRDSPPMSTTSRWHSTARPIGARIRFRRPARRRWRKRPDGRPRRLSGAIRGRLRRPHRPAPGTAQAQLHIFGHLEARLTQRDRVILGGLIEGVWPPEPRDRSVAEPADAPRARPRPAGAAHRPLRARFCATDGRTRRHPDPRGQGRRRASGRLALSAPTGSSGGRGALEGARRGGGKYVYLRRGSISRHASSRSNSRAKAAARPSGRDCR